MKYENISDPCCQGFDTPYCNDAPCRWEVETNMAGRCSDCPYNTRKCVDCAHYAHCEGVSA